MGYAPPRTDPRHIAVNLLSDTQTKPTAAMRAFMMDAEVGDEQEGTDPSIHALCDRMAALLGKEAAMFLPTGTMCNQIAVLTQCRAGDEILAHPLSHLACSEGGAAWALSGVAVAPLPGARGQFSADTLAAALRGPSRYSATQRMVLVEQTANLGGGTVWALNDLRAVAALAHAHGLRTHMDGARLLNAAVASGESAADMAAGYDTVWLDFTKGLGAPLGAVLAGSTETIDAAWRWKQRLGGSLRQGGINAAACLYALDHHVARLAEDHALAKELARGLAQIPGIQVETPETNLVFLDVQETGITAADIQARVREAGVAVLAMGPHRIRACTHLDVTRSGVAVAVTAFRHAVVN